MKKVRSFIAIEISAEIQEELARIQAELKKPNADVKWMNPSGIHLTLKFLGNVSAELIEEIKKVVKEVAENHKCFEMKTSHLGAFPRIEHPRVIWVGIEQGKEKAIQIARDLEEHLIKFGFLREKRPFNPHLTLGRVRSARNHTQLKKLLDSLNFPQKSIRVEKIVLFKSTLTSQGAVYHPLYETHLS